jgi:guanylate kinase
LIVVISGPSGSGKDSIVKKLALEKKDMSISVSVTTRSPRPGETEGIDYFFVSTEHFKEMIWQGKLVEWDCFCDNYYGTPKDYIEKFSGLGYDIFLVITVEGALEVKKAYPDSVLVFILPPSLETLEARIKGRGTEPEEKITKRLREASDEIAHAKEFDYAIVNDKLSSAVSQLKSVLEAEKTRTYRIKGFLEYYMEVYGGNDS